MLFMPSRAFWVFRFRVLLVSGVSPGAQDDLDRKTGSGAILGLDAGLEELLLAMQKNVTNQVLPWVAAQLMRAMCHYALCAGLRHCCGTPCCLEPPLSVTVSLRGGGHTVEVGTLKPKP